MSILAHRSSISALGPGLAAVGAAVAVGYGVATTIRPLSVLIVCLLLGAFARNVGALRPSMGPGIEFSAKRLLRLGVVLLGFQLSFEQLGSIGGAVLAIVLGTVTITFLSTFWVSTRLGASTGAGLLVSAGFSICGASAIAATGSVIGSDDDDLMLALTLVTLFGSIWMLLIPVVGRVLGMDVWSVGVWAGASVHEVAQVIIAAEAAGDAAIGIAVSVKLARVVLLAPVIAGIGLYTKRRDAAGGGTSIRMPLFVLGFIASAAIRTSGHVPSNILRVLALTQDVSLGAAMFGMGTQVDVGRLLSMGVRSLRIGVISTGIAAGSSLAGLWLVVG